MSGQKPILLREFSELGKLLVFALQRPLPTSVNTTLTHELVFMRDKTSLIVTSCRSGTDAEVTGRRMTSEQRGAGVITEARGSMRDPFDAHLLERGPVHRKGLRAGPNDHADKLKGLPCGEPNRFIGHLDTASLLCSSYSSYTKKSGRLARHGDHSCFSAAFSMVSDPPLAQSPLRPVQSDSYTHSDLDPVCHFHRSGALIYTLNMQTKRLQTRNIKGNLHETGFQWHIGSMLVYHNVPQL
jgi:hypothetical protein